MLPHMFQGSDWLIDIKTNIIGTTVEMTIDTHSTRSLLGVFKENPAPDDPGFSRTRVPVSLAEYGDENLVSRSQAKRLLGRLDRFIDSRKSSSTSTASG
jgi:hypothetical protein